MAISLPGESQAYRAARDRLLEQEAELRRAMEAVAATRRELPPGGAVPEDYVFHRAGPDGAPAEVRLSELFEPGKDSLAIYSTALLDQLDGAADHVGQHLNFAVVAKAPLPRVLTFARERGMRRLRLLSSAGNSYNTDYFAETAAGFQRPMLTVFHRDGDLIRHFWSSELALRAIGAGAGATPRRHARAALEHVRPDSRGPSDRLGRAVQLSTYTGVRLGRA